MVFRKISKRIYVVRHAKSSWGDLTITDKLRPLNARGERDAPVMADWCLKHGHIPELIISSTATRAANTAKVFADKLKLTNENIRKSDDLYHAPAYTYMESCFSLSEDIKSVMLFGHNPGITHLANEVGEKFISNVPTCGILVIDSKCKTWQDLDFDNCSLLQLITPKSLPK